MVRIEDYFYQLPDELVAREPSTERDGARLFVYDTKTDTITHDIFKNISAHLPHPALLVMNNTQVVPARTWLTKETGGKIEVLFLVNEGEAAPGVVKGVVDRRISVGSTLKFADGASVTVIRQEEQFFYFHIDRTFDEFILLLFKEGVTPIPPYIKQSPLNEKSLREQYQSVLAQYPASIAAPTASLHFSKNLLHTLEQEHIPHTEVTLHVGAGTFAPISQDNITQKKLFTETYYINKKSAETITTARVSGVPIIPIGTTAMRTLESAARLTTQNTIETTSGKTDIFIYPPFQFHVTTHFVTNFHVPCSSLMMLVDAFLKHKKAQRDVLALYQIAIEERYRFYSFGDGMLIL